MLVVMIGAQPDGRGMLLDFKEVKRAIRPVTDAWDHATLVSEGDTELLDIMQRTGWKHAVLPFETTSENLCAYVADYICDQAKALLHQHHITSVQVRIEETETSYAEVERVVPQAHTAVKASGDIRPESAS